MKSVPDLDFGLRPMPPRTIVSQEHAVRTAEQKEFLSEPFANDNGRASIGSLLFRLWLAWSPLYWVLPR